jgi:hypothetical protein
MMKAVGWLLFSWGVFICFALFYIYCVGQAQGETFWWYGSAKGWAAGAFSLWGVCISIAGGWLLASSERSTPIRNAVGWLLLSFGLLGVGVCAYIFVAELVHTLRSRDPYIFEALVYLLPVLGCAIMVVGGWMLSHPEAATNGDSVVVR